MAEQYTTGGRRLIPNPNQPGVFMADPNQAFNPSNPDVTGGMQQEGDLVSITNQVLAALAAKGMTLNPNVQLTPEKLAEFLKMAEAEVEPGFQAKLRLSKETLLRNLGYDMDSIKQFNVETERKYGQDLRKLGENFAEQGMALSGRRKLDEETLADTTQKQLLDKRRDLGFQAGTEAVGFLKDYGTRNLPNAPMMDETPQAIPGQMNFQRSGRQSPYYSLSSSLVDNIVGEQEKNKLTGIRTLAQEYEGLYRKGQAIPNPRDINL